MRMRLLLVLLAVTLLLVLAPGSICQAAQLDYRMADEFPPYRVKTGGGVEGFEIDLAHELFKHSSYVPIFTIGRASPPAGDLQVYGWREIANKTDDFKYSEPLFSYRWGPFSRASENKRPDSRLMTNSVVGVVRNHYPHLYLGGEKLGNMRVYEKAPDAVNALLSGEIDFLYDEAESIRHLLIATKKDNVVRYHHELETTTPVGISAPKNNAEIITMINKRMKTIRRNGVYESLYQNRFLANSPFYLNERRAKAFQTASVLVVLFSLVGVLIVFIWYRQRLAVTEEKSFSDTLIENSNSFILIWDENLNISRSNRRVENSLGYSKETLATMSITAIMRLPETFGGYSQVIPLLAKDGRTIDVLWDTSRFSMDRDRKRFIMALGSDITEITKLRLSLEASLDQLRESEHRYELATSGGNVGIISCNVVAEEVYISPVGWKLLGYEAPYPQISYTEWMSMIHPSDIKLFQLNIFTIENEASATPSSEVRVCRKEGDYKWFLFSIKAQQLDDDKLTVLSGAFFDIDKRKSLELATRRLAFEDPVCGILNRNYLMTEGEKVLMRAQKNSFSVCLVIFDIDDFKLINMHGGVAVGDQLLRQVGERAKQFLGPVGILARLSGDEFACLIPLDSSEQANAKLTTAMNALGEVVRGIDASAYGVKKVTFCAGSSMFPIDATDLPGLIENANLSLLAAKNQGAGSVKIYDNNVKSSARRDDILQRDIHDILRNNQLKIYYQPKVDLSTGIIHGAEALARWAHPDFGIIRPDYFIKVAGDLGVVLALDYQVLRETCRQNAKWQQQGLPPISISVNMSAEGFFNERTVDYVRSVLDETGLEPCWLEIEVTESQAMRDIDRAIKSMKRIGSLGVTLSLDDFGTGYSSLNYLKQLPVKIIKLDRSFILDIESNSASQMIVATMVQLSKKLNLKVTAEGVENHIQELHLRNIGCEFGQGYLYSKPVPGERFETFLKKGTISKQRVDA